MTHLTRPPLAMGLMMGLMIPFMLHAETGAGLGFVLTHLAVLAIIAGLFLLIPALRPRLRALLAHRPRLGHVPLMALGLGAGWAMICALCLAIDGSHF